MIEKLLLQDVLGLAGEHSLEPLRREFPTVRIGWTRAPRVWVTTVRVDEWRAPDFPGAFDAFLAGAGRPVETVLVHGGAPGELTATAREVLTRYQHRNRRRNQHSEGSWFDCVLRLHRSVHGDLARRLVLADYLHTLDVWQWVLRLEPEASLTLQLAALFHDVERLISEVERPVEQRAADYQGFKNAHAEVGGRLARSLLSRVGLAPAEIVRVEELIVSHEAPTGDREVDLLNDADALSFLSLNSAGFLDHFGPGHTRRKLCFTLARMSPAARHRIGQIRLRPEVARLLHEGIVDGRRARPQEQAA